MGKLFVFGIGGTGSRVLKSLTMLLMAGVKLNVDEIIPIIIDKDETNGDMLRTKELIDKYLETRGALVNDSGKFFSTKMTLLNDNLILPLVDKQKKFSDYISYNQLHKEDKALADALFSKNALNMVTTEGFRGIPSIGSVVLNQFENTESINTFANLFKSGDKIFIVSSIFGGTGASGFPLLVKTLRSNINLPNWDSVNKAPIGSISVLPYFIVGESNETNKVNVDSDTFYSKAKAALAYYSETLDGKIDSMYYVGDKKFSKFDYNAGGDKQSNEAHFVELLAALSIVDFASKSFSTDRTIETKYYEFGYNPEKVNSESIVFSSLHTETRKIICNPLIQFYVFNQYMKYVFNGQHKHQPWSHNYPFKKQNNYDNIYMDSDAMKNLNDCFQYFVKWLEELGCEKHQHRFEPFNLKTTTFNFIKGNSSDMSVRNGSFRYKNWSWFDNQLNKIAHNKDVNVSDSLSKDQRFLEMFYRASQVFVRTLIPNSQNNK